MTFQKFVPKHRQGRTSPITDLEVGEICYLLETSLRKLRMRIYQIERRTSMKFEYQECKNGGVIIRRYE